jgi:hypothetical protein
LVKTLLCGSVQEIKTHCVWKQSQRFRAQSFLPLETLLWQVSHQEFEAFTELQENWTRGHSFDDYRLIMQEQAQLVRTITGMLDTIFVNMHIRALLHMSNRTYRTQGAFSGS